MPIIESSNFRPSFWLPHSHFQTIYAGLLRPAKVEKFVRERINTPDGDFFDLDWSRVGSKKLVLLLHGLEGNSERAYIQGMLRIFNRNNWDVVAINFRGCSGEPNRLFSSYHSGFTTDVRHTVQLMESRGEYEQLALIGFSLGGNVALKFLGEEGRSLSSKLKAAVCFSTPCDLEDSSSRIQKWDNRLYLWRFLSSLKAKAELKADLYPKEFSLKAVKKARNFKEYDDAYTAPAHGFKDAVDYWDRSSCGQFIPNIRIPCLLVNAADDSFLGKKCYPFRAAKNNPNFFLEVPDFGGHVGFIDGGQNDVLWSESRALTFIMQNC